MPLNKHTKQTKSPEICAIPTNAALKAHDCVMLDPTALPEERIILWDGVDPCPIGWLLKDADEGCIGSVRKITAFELKELIQSGTAGVPPHAICDHTDIPASTGGQDQFLCINDGVCSFQSKSAIIAALETTTTFTYNTTTCTLTYVNEDGVLTNAILPQESLTFNSATCTFTWVDGKGVSSNFTIPQSSLAFNPTTCTFTFSDGKQASPTTFTLPQPEIKLAADGCSFSFKAKPTDTAVNIPFPMPQELDLKEYANNCLIVLNDKNGDPVSKIDVSNLEQTLGQDLNGDGCLVTLTLDDKKGVVKDKIDLTKIDVCDLKNTDKLLSSIETNIDDCIIEGKNKDGDIIAKADISDLEQTLGEALNADNCLTTLTLTGKDGNVKDKIDVTNINICDLKPVKDTNVTAGIDYELCVTGSGANKDCKLIPKVSGGTLDKKICTGVFNNCGSRSGWWTGTSFWTPVRTANTGTVQVNDWVNLGTGVTSPNSVTDLTFTIDYGLIYVIMRRFRMWFWADYRLLLNGGAVLTRTFDRYFYHSENSDTNPDVIEPIQYTLKELGTTVDHRDNVAASSTVQVQVRSRVNFNGAQSSAYGRVLAGLRGQVIYNFSLNQYIEDVNLL